jgi:hypothetical protein
MLRSRPRRRSDDSGLTLIELIVAASLAILAGTVLVGVFSMTQRTEATIRTTASATTTGQFVSSTIDRAIRNSEAIDVVPIGSDLLVRARTIGSGSDASWRCAAWYYSAADSTIRQTSSPALISAPTAVVQRSWTLLAGGVSAIPSTPVFNVSTSLGGGQTLSFAFRISAGTSPAVSFQDASSHPVAGTGPLACF